jgi:four helix bundle protein
MNDKVDDLRFYQMAMTLWEDCWGDCEILSKDFRGKEVAKQLIRSVGSISANIEEGYGRGFGKEYPHFLRIARGSARESRGWYTRSKQLLNKDIIEHRIAELSSVIAMLTKSIQTIENSKT